METLSLNGRTFGLVASEPGAPLILYLHGSTQTIAEARAFTRRMFEDVGAHVIYPQGVDGIFNDLRNPNPGSTTSPFCAPSSTGRRRAWSPRR